MPDMARLALRSIVLGVVLLGVSCSRPPPVIGIDNPDIPTRSVANAIHHKVFVATTREDSEVVGALFSELRAAELGLAAVTVSVPPQHKVGELERPKSIPPNPRKEFAVIEPTIFESKGGFVSALNHELRQRRAGDRDILFFVHGYNTTTSEAILRVGQFVEDSGFKGVPVLFTWASAGKFSRYVYDLNSALVARPQLLEATAIISQSIASEYHIFAHSMGGFLTMEAIVDAAQAGDFDQTGRLRNVVLASPDIDYDLFRSQIGQIDTTFDRFFVLLSHDDYALRASRIIAGGVPRVGAADAEDLAQLGVNAIDLSEIHDQNSDSHSKFAGSPEVVQLLGLGLNKAPDLGASRVSPLADLIRDVPIRFVRAIAE